MPYGFSGVKVWNRGHEATAKDKSHGKNMAPISKKNPISGYNLRLKSKEVPAGAREVIIIQDREGDIYEQFCVVPDERTHLLIRAKANSN